MKLSQFGEKFAGRSGIVELMDDLSYALSENPQMIFMGGGNPARLAAVEEVFQRRLQEVLDDPEQRHQLFGVYQSPKGESEFCRQVAELLRREFGWQLSERNVAVSNGSQSAFFVLFNMFAGKQTDGSNKTIHLPVTPEYIGYSDIGVEAGMFSASRPTIEKIEHHLFKYHVDFSNLKLTSGIAALAASRPTNPTGNVLTDDEIASLDTLAREHDIPFILDGAYGLPFPGILFNDATPFWNENTILVLSLSKLGLPGTRTGIIVASEEIVEAYSRANTVLSLACGNFGPAIAKQLFASGEILTIGRKTLAAFYQERAWQTLNWFRDAMSDLPCRIHTPEGAIFLWLWFEGMPISSMELYERLKSRGVLVVPGCQFFPGLEDDWQHRQECIRVSYAQDPGSIKKGVQIIADEVRAAFLRG
ncbi:MAG: valine--pyruvate transaminase [Pseudomonadales bacterium]|nr:valine--pyruvate transaminase [Pseudomonadales bacterium]MCP5173117.1 valine--pyruvate transaminase [Pseudomonadales bacterium]